MSKITKQTGRGQPPPRPAPSTRVYSPRGGDEIPRLVGTPSTYKYQHKLMIVPPSRVTRYQAALGTRVSVQGWERVPVSQINSEHACQRRLQRVLDACAVLESERKGKRRRGRENT
jgi:hypothetical protein